LHKVHQIQKQKVKVVGTIYRRTRNGHQRAEVRFDGLAGCLRTPGGGSSRQTIIVVKGDSVRSRLLSAREAARLMGLTDSYKLPARYNDAYHLAGDGVAVPVVAHLKQHLFNPILSANPTIELPELVAQ
jgi:DNA (cytosine-5)-methyltransferase 1